MRVWTLVTCGMLLGAATPAVAQVSVAGIRNLAFGPVIVGIPSTEMLVKLDPASVKGQAALILAALPTGANAFVLAKQFDIAVEQNTAAVLLSTALSVFTVSALLVWLHVT